LDHPKYPFILDQNPVWPVSGIEKVLRGLHADAEEFQKGSRPCFVGYDGSNVQHPTLNIQRSKNHLYLVDLNGEVQVVSTTRYSLPATHYCFTPESHELTRTALELPTEHTDYTEELREKKGGNSTMTGRALLVMMAATFNIQH
jgi:hypothetical protein